MVTRRQRGFNPQDSRAQEHHLQAFRQRGKGEEQTCSRTTDIVPSSSLGCCPQPGDSPLVLVGAQSLPAGGVSPAPPGDPGPWERRVGTKPSRSPGKPAWRVPSSPGLFPGCQVPAVPQLTDPASPSLKAGGRTGRGRDARQAHGRVRREGAPRRLPALGPRMAGEKGDRSSWKPCPC